MTYETTDGAVRAEQLFALTLPNRDGRRPKVNLKHWAMAIRPMLAGFLVFLTYKLNHSVMFSRNRRI